MRYTFNMGFYERLRTDSSDTAEKIIPIRLSETEYVRQAQRALRDANAANRDIVNFSWNPDMQDTGMRQNLHTAIEAIKIPGVSFSIQERPDGMDVVLRREKLLEAAE